MHETSKQWQHLVSFWTKLNFPFKMHETNIPFSARRTFGGRMGRLQTFVFLGGQMESRKWKIHNWWADGAGSTTALHVQTFDSDTVSCNESADLMNVKQFDCAYHHEVTPFLAHQIDAVISSIVCIFLWNKNGFFSSKDILPFVWAMWSSQNRYFGSRLPNGWERCEEVDRNHHDLC